MVIQAGYLHSYKACNALQWCYNPLFLQDNQPRAVHEAGWPELRGHRVRVPQSHLGPHGAPVCSDALMLYYST